MRGSGILMHITSLSSPYGVGTMGKEAYRFVDFLQRAGQQYWQILPVTPTGFGDSPYQSCSAFAGNPYLIDLDMLVADGLLKKSEVKKIRWSDTPDRVDFGRLYHHRPDVLRLAWRRFSRLEALEAFCHANDGWIWDYAMFMALKQQHGGKPWYQWEEKLKFRDDAALTDAWHILKEEIDFHCFVQYLFHTQWEALRDYAHEKGVKIIGDVPIYVPLDSAEVWSNPRLFWLDEKLDPVAVAGCPPDGFTADGQLWGNPLYRWEAHKAEGFRWWVQRMAAAGRRYDLVRLDHFRGFESYWAVPYGDQTAKGGKWMPGPGMDFVNALKNQLPHVQIIAEDLGALDTGVYNLIRLTGFPGMNVWQFSADEMQAMTPEQCRNRIFYSGTHDNQTLTGWCAAAFPEEDAAARADEIIRALYESAAPWAIVQLQDMLSLDDEARLNVPGTPEGNWRWRVDAALLTDETAQRYRKLAEETKR